MQQKRHASPAAAAAGGIDDRLGQGQTLFAVFAAYFLLNFAVRLVLPHGLELDEAEQTHFSQWLLAGYSSQPPFYNWLQYATFKVFGISLASLSGLKNVLLFSSYLCYWLAARQVLRQRGLAVVAALGLITIPQVAFEAQRDLSHTVAAIFGASFFMFALLRTLSAPTLGAFLLFGIATGIGGITKYNFILLPAAAFLAMLCDKQLRARLLDWRLIPAGVIALVIIMPHALWLLDNFQATSSHTMRKLVGDDSVIGGIAKGMGTLALSALGFCALTLVVFAAVYRDRIRTVLGAENQWSRLVGRILIFSLALIVLMILFAGVEKVRDRWLTPVLVLVPLYLALKLDAANIALRPGLKRLWVVAGVIMVLIPSILFGRVAIDRYTGKYGYVNIPFSALARQAAASMQGAPAIIVASDGQLAGAMRFNLTDTTVVTPEPPTGMTPVALAPYRRVIFVWRDSDGDAPKSFDETFGDYLNQQNIAARPVDPAVVSYSYLWGRPGDQYQFGMAVMDLPK